VEFARQQNAFILFGLRDPDVDVARRCGVGVVVCGHATDTVGEAISALIAVQTNHVTHLYISTERGHLFRAWIISAILHLFTGVKVERIPDPVDDGYRSPYLRTIKDICRALWYRIRHA
jgi:hypothetical protein